MGATKNTYFITTKPLEEQEFFEWKQHQPIENWKAEPNDKELFKDDDTYKSLLKDYFKCKKELDNYKFNKRHQ